MIFPAIDIMDGGCVRLLKGDFGLRTQYHINPIVMAKSFADAGAKWLHIVDLDGAKNGLIAQSDLIIQIAKSCGLNVQTGGGLRQFSQLQNLLNNGIKRVVIGSLAIKNPKLVKNWMHELGPEKIVLAIDVLLDETGVARPAIEGWQQTSTQNLWQVLDTFMDAGLQTILVTDIAKDGGLQGANIQLYQQIIRRFPQLDLITSGGVGSLEDIHALKALHPAGIIIGKALYENRFTLQEAISC